MTPRRSRRPWRLVALEDRVNPAPLLPDLHVLANNLNGWFVTTAVNGAREIRFDTSLANIGQGAFGLWFKFIGENVPFIVLPPLVLSATHLQIDHLTRRAGPRQDDVTTA